MPPTPSPTPTRRARSAIALALAALCALAATATGPAPGAPSISGQRTEVQALGRQVAALDARSGEAAAAHNGAIDRMEAATALLERTRRDLVGAERDLVRSQELLSGRLRTLYVERPPSFVEVLLSTGSVAEAHETSELLDRVAQGDAAMVERVRERRERLARLKAVQGEARARRGRELATAAAQRREIAAVLAERRRVLGSARAELTRMVRAERIRRAQAAALYRAQRAAASVPTRASNELTVVPSALPAGDHAFPVAGPTRFTDDWLAPRAGGRVHQGIDFFADRGTPVVAVADGSLFRVGYNGLGGWRLWLRDGAGTTFYYAHLSAYSPAAREGARVGRGTVLGYVGDTGDAQGTSPHLHFEIHPGGGSPVPPYPIVTGWPRVG